MAAVEFGFIPVISGLTVKFRLTGQVPPTFPVGWDFGDSKEEYNKRDVTHTYEGSGFYQVTVSYTDTQKGETYTYSQVIVVKGYCLSVEIRKACNLSPGIVSVFPDISKCVCYCADSV